METNNTEIPESLDLSSPLWFFALDFWQTPGVEPLCLALQNKGWSVTRLLCACWLASVGREFTGEPVTVTQWRQQMTTAIRALKKSLPKHHKALVKLRKQLTSTELEAERIELALVWQAISAESVSGNKTRQSMALVRHNLYAAAPDPHINQEAHELINQLTTFTLPDSSIQADR